MALNLWTAPSCPSVGCSFCWKRLAAPPGRHWKLWWQFQWDGANKVRVTLDRSWDYIFRSPSRFKASFPSRNLMLYTQQKTCSKDLVVQHFTSWKKRKSSKWWWIIVTSLEKWKLFLASVPPVQKAQQWNTVLQFSSGIWYVWVETLK